MKNNVSNANEKPEWVDIGGIGRTGASDPLFYGEPAWGDDILQISKLDFSGRNENIKKSEDVTSNSRCNEWSDALTNKEKQDEL